MYFGLVFNGSCLLLVILCDCLLGSFLVAGRMAKVLFDSGSSFSYICKSFAAEMKDRPAHLAFHLNVMTPLGERSLAWKYLRSVNIALNGRDFKANLIIMGMQV